jgi:nucleotide-binding universal stress UspA family protein
MTPRGTVLEEEDMTVFRHLLVPHDFSAAATNALRVAARLLAPGGRMTVLHAITPYTPVTDISPAALSTYVPPQELVASARRGLERVIREHVPARLRSRVDARIVMGDPYQRIIQATRGMDTIVMSTAGPASRTS